MHRVGRAASRLTNDPSKGTVVPTNRDYVRSAGRTKMSGLLRQFVIIPFLSMLLVASSAMAESHPDRSQVSGPDLGVAITPAVYFVNFLFMYVAVSFEHLTSPDFDVSQQINQ